MQDSMESGVLSSKQHPKRTEADSMVKARASPKSVTHSGYVVRGSQCASTTIDGRSDDPTSVLRDTWAECRDSDSAASDKSDGSKTSSHGSKTKRSSVNGNEFRDSDSAASKRLDDATISSQGSQTKPSSSNEKEQECTGTNQGGFFMESIISSIQSLCSPTANTATVSSNENAAVSSNENATVSSYENSTVSSKGNATVSSRDGITFWSSLSAHVAIAAIKANGSDEVAQKAANAVIQAGKKRHWTTSSLNKVAAEVSAEVLKGGGDDVVAAAVTVVIIMAALESKKKSKHDETRVTFKGDQSVISFLSNTSQSVASATPSIRLKRNQLKEREDEIAQRTWAIEEAEQLYRDKEKDIDERMAALDATEAALLENSNFDGRSSKSKQLKGFFPFSKIGSKKPTNKKFNHEARTMGPLSSFKNKNGQKTEV